MKISYAYSVVGTEVVPNDLVPRSSGRPQSLAFVEAFMVPATTPADSQISVLLLEQ
jgi:hypothetical protein